MPTKQFVPMHVTEEVRLKIRALKGTKSYSDYLDSLIVGETDN